jgi:hypothetical protein
MGGGLMQLVAYGAQDIYLTGNPQITFFKVVYRRHTNFSMEAIEQTLNGSVGYGNKVTSTVSRNGDLVGRMYLEVDVSDIDGTNDDTCANFGTALINEVDVEIGGQRIDKHYGHSMEAFSELTEENASGHVGVLAAGVSTNGTVFQNMSMSGGFEGLRGVGTTTLNTIYVPLQFWFCKNAGLALPLIALQYHEVKVSVKFQTELLCIAAGATAPATTLAAKLWADYIYLDTDERRRFAQVSHEYLIEQLQFQNQASSTSHNLNFNHPVKELVWTGTTTNATVADSATSGELGPSTHLALVDTTYKLTLNGHDRFAARNRGYFTRTQVWQHHSGFGGMDVDNSAPGCLDSIAVYSFALKPEEHQPSGTCNFSRIDNAQLKLGSADALYIYAVNYNVLRIMSGMGGLAYSN